MQSTKHNNNHITLPNKCEYDHTLITIHIIFQNMHSKHNLRLGKVELVVVCIHILLTIDIKKINLSKEINKAIESSINKILGCRFLLCFLKKKYFNKYFFFLF